MADSYLYLDSSAYLAILLGEVESAKILKIISKKIVCSSMLLVIETERNLVRLSRESILDADDFQTALKKLKGDVRKFVLKDVSMDLCLTGVFPPVQIPRSNDLMHLRTALWFMDHHALESFISLDTKQIKAAASMGIPVGD